MIYTDINFHKILSILNTLKDNQLNKMNFLIKIYILQVLSAVKYDKEESMAFYFKVHNSSRSGYTGIPLRFLRNDVLF